MFSRLTLDPWLNGHARHGFNAICGAFAGTGGALACLLMVLLPAGPAVSAETIRLLALGDSLTAGFGVAPAEAFPARLEAALRGRGHDVQVINAGVSGDTTSGGLARLDWVLADAPHAVIVELGANDALRVVDPQVTRQNLDRILATLAERDIPTLLAGMLAPRNLDMTYREAFEGAFPALAQKYDTLFYPFFLDGVAAVSDLNQEDGMHPNAQGVEEIVSRMLPSVEQLLARVRAAQQVSQ